MNLTLWQKLYLGAGLLFLLTGLGIFVYYYVRFSRAIDAHLSGDVFNHASVIFSAPEEITVGEAISPEVVEARLTKALYTENGGGSKVGTFDSKGNRLDVYPGSKSFFDGREFPEGPAELAFRDGKLESITSLDGSKPLQSYLLEPEVITTLFDRERGKRLLVRYQDLPPVLINAVLAAEDSRFFSHFGINVFRIIEAAIADLRTDTRSQGGSTLTMQVARNIILMNRSRTFRRKLEEVFVALLLEQRLTKEQIFTLYANQVYLGQRGSFSIYGFGEASNAYFNKNVQSLTLPEAALLAGMIRGPNLYLPYKYPSRALERRNWVLRRMIDTGAINAKTAEVAEMAPLGLTRQNEEGNEAPYFVDLVRDQLLNQFSEEELASEGYRVYTTLDMNLQRAASDGVREGLVDVDQRVKRQRPPKGFPPAGPDQPQIALIALDPHTGFVRALIGGRDYGQSQLDHAVAKRQPGSSFKPFVYATALSSGIDGSQPLITPATILQDEPTTFEFNGQPYEPEDYMDEYHGLVTVRQAIMLSLNVATVSLAQMVGYEKIRDLAIQAGINSDLEATPAIALGSYVVTPYEMAGGYTIFANDGVYVAPRCVLAVKDASGATLWASPLVTRRVLDPRVAYLMVSLLQSVVNNGTGYGVRARGFTAPVAGKTGTLNDGWFAGFTSDLLSVVWVGYDDDRDLNLVGASSALPLWTDFMKEAIEIPPYSNPQPFEAPPGVETAAIDTRTNLVAAPDSTTTREEVFIAGTEPLTASPLPGGTPSSQPSGVGGVLSRIFHSSNTPVDAPALAAPPPLPPGAPPPIDPSLINPVQQAPVPLPKPNGGVLKKFLSIFKGKDSNSKPQPPPEKKQGTQQ